jgi:hypothetical protein
MGIVLLSLFFYYNYTGKKKVHTNHSRSISPPLK